MELELSVSRCYYQYRYPMSKILKEFNLSKATGYRIIRKFAAENPQKVEDMKKNQTPDDLSKENVALRRHLAEMEKALYNANMRADALDKMVDIAERLYKIPVRKKLGSKP